MAAFYKRNKGNAGLDGVQFQVGLSTVFLLNAYRNIKGWRISTENEVAGKFDDLVIEFSDGSAILLQAKHKDCKRINKDQLLSDNSRNANFSLPKYFLSYQEIKSRFNVKNIVICTNADVNMKKIKDILEPQTISVDSILHYEGEACSYLKFNENVLPFLKKNSESYLEKNLQGIGIDKEIITNENLKDFLEKLQLFSGYPSKSQLDSVINKLLSRLTYSKLWSGMSSQEIYEKVEDWFKDQRGEYLNETLANRMFCEIRSDKYRQSLQDYKVSFDCVDFSFTEGKRMFHICIEERYFLQILKIYHALQEKSTLYVNPYDDVELHKLALEAFDSSNHEFLVLVPIKNSNRQSVSDMNHKLKNIFDAHSYKKVVIIGTKQIVPQLGLNDILELDGTVMWKTLKLQCRERLLCKKNITFQGVNVSLGELLPTSEVEDYDKAVNSDVLETLVKDEKFQVGKPPTGMDQSTTKFYVSRRFERDIVVTDEIFISRKIRETVTEDDIFDVKEKAILITDIAGMGKSTVLAKLGTDLKEKNPLNWIFRIELNNYSRILKEAMRKSKGTITLKELLNSNAATKLTNELEEYLLSMPDRTVLMLDGFDEISPYYTKIILNLISKCYASPNFSKIIVTTRPYVSWELEGILQVKPFALQPLTKKDQIAFLTSYWGHHLKLDLTNKERCEKYAEALINKMASWINTKNSFAANPLQVRMLAEIFQENVTWNKSTEWEGCKEFLYGVEEKPTLPERMKLIKLFDMFIDKKFDIFLDKANPNGTAVINSLFISNFQKYFRNHQYLALKAVLGNDTMQDPNIMPLFSSFQYDKHVEMEILKIGVVQVQTNEEIQFVHRTFVEYFAAKSIIEISQLSNRSLNQDTHFQILFIERILDDYEHTVIRSFIESILEDVVDSLPASSLENYQRFATGHRNSVTRRSQFLHLLAKDGCISIIRFIIKCLSHSVNETVATADDRSANHNTLNVLRSLMETDGINIRDQNGNTPLHYASDEGYFDVVKYLVYDSKTPEGSLSVVNDMRALVKHTVDLNVLGKEGHTALHLAAGQGHFNVLTFLAERGAEVNMRNNEYFTPLHSAAEKGHLQIVKFLRERGLDADLRNDKGFTALHLASLNGHVEVVKFLVGNGADLNIKDEMGLSAMQCAAIREKFDTLLYLKSLGQDINASNNNGMSVLLVAIRAGDSRCVKSLVGCGADVNASENTGLSALHLAAQGGRLDILMFLIPSGANLKAVNNTGESVLHSAANEGHLDIVKFLIESGGLLDARDDNGHTAFHAAAAGGHVDIVEYFLNCGMDINTVDNDSCTGLYYAAQKGHLSTVKYLVDCGAHVNVCSKRGFSPLYVAALGGHLGIIEFLVDHDANVSITDNEGITTLHAACIRGHLDVAKFFVEHNIDVNVCDEDGVTPLHSAAWFGHLEIVEFLLKSGAVIDETNHAGCFTPLHMASQNGHLHVVKFLVDSGACIGTTNHDGFTAVHMAVQRGHLDVVKHFVEIGVDVNVLNNDGVTALQSACEEGHLDIVMFLLQLNVDVNVANKNSITPLHLAAQHGHLDTVKCLIEHGADISAEDDRGRTLLEIVTEEGHVDIVSYLVECSSYISVGH